MSESLLTAVRAKLSRAHRQLEDLERELLAFVRNCPYGMASRYVPETDVDVWHWTLESPIPVELPILAGELLHNARSALDQIVCQAASSHGGSTSDVYFPAARNAEHFEERIKRLGNKIPLDVAAVLRDAKPYPDGNPMLWLLHDLNRRDKHLELVPINLRTVGSAASRITVLSGMALVLGPRCGQHLIVERRPAEEVAAMESPTAIYETPPGTSVSFSTSGCTGAQTTEFLTTTPGARFVTDMQPEFSLAFASDLCETEPAQHVLRSILVAAERVIDGLDVRYFSKLDLSRI